MGADLNMMDAVYFHAKTTPKMPIYLAARASASIPGRIRYTLNLGSRLKDNRITLSIVLMYSLEKASFG